MRISQAQISEQNGRTRLTARVTHEAVDRPAEDIFFEVNTRHKDHLRLLNEAFLLCSFPAALFHGEKRIVVEGPLCPELVANLRAAMLLQKLWWGDTQAIPVIESTGSHVLDRSQAGTGCFLSGGVDSMSSFCRNISLYGRGDSRRITQAVFVYGMDVGNPNTIERYDLFDNSTRKFSAFLAEHGCELIPLYTNARNVEPNWKFYEERHFGALLAGIAHAMSNRFDACQVALDLRSDNSDEWGSHPWLNKYFSSSAVSVDSVMDSYTRIEKYDFIAQVPGALDVLRVCYITSDVAEGELNCGLCAKCTRTKVELLAQGLLERATTFADKTIAHDSVRKMSVSHRHDLEFIEAPIERLRQRGHNDIADQLQRKVDRYKKGPSLPHRFLHKIKKIDNEHFNNRLASVAKRVGIRLDN